MRTDAGIESIDLGKILVISPHLDDAVFSCGELIARHPDTTVLTVFAGLPQHPKIRTAWDVESGFFDATQAISARREEDRRALALLNATGLWLEFPDSQYGTVAALHALAERLSMAVQRADPNTVVLPAGLHHLDHTRVHQAMLHVRKQISGVRWLMYEDAIYRRIPGQLQKRLVRLAWSGIEATPASMADCGEALIKRHAVQCYVSQLRALAQHSGYNDVFMPEKYWTLEALHWTTQVRRSTIFTSGKRILKAMVRS